ncbi:MAG TPA: hypothetical protein VHB20_04265 [Verrucomicrobiae bacterium]|jgi:hypothetical protein|nr:hypothetical protein [Verrucomicrobiae bacterium]
MVIQPNTPADPSANLAANRPHHPKANSAAESTDAQNWPNISVSDADDLGDFDAATADQLMQSLTKSMAGNSGAVLQAHSPMNSQTAIDLLQ